MFSQVPQGGRGDLLRVVWRPSSAEDTSSNADFKVNCVAFFSGNGDSAGRPVFERPLDHSSDFPIGDTFVRKGLLEGI